MKGLQELEDFGAFYKLLELLIHLTRADCGSYYRGFFRRKTANTAL